MNDQQREQLVPAMQPVYVQAVRPAGNGFATAGLTLGIITIVIGVLPLIGLFISFVPTVLAIVFSIIGISKSQRVQTGLGRSITGLILGGLTFLLYFTGYGLLW